MVTSLAPGGALSGPNLMASDDGAMVGIVVVAVRLGGSPVAVPGPIAGAGLPALLALGGFVLWACRRKFVRGPMISL